MSNVWMSSKLLIDEQCHNIISHLDHIQMARRLTTTSPRTALAVHGVHGCMSRGRSLTNLAEKDIACYELTLYYFGSIITFLSVMDSVLLSLWGTHIRVRQSNILQNVVVEAFSTTWVTANMYIAHAESRILPLNTLCTQHQGAPKCAGYSIYYLGICWMGLGAGRFGEGPWSEGGTAEGGGLGFLKCERSYFLPVHDNY